MSFEVAIVDYGIGNIFSVRRALEVCGATVRLVEQPGELALAERVVLPGVGAFADGMRGLAERGLVAPLQEFGRSGRPLLGICLGMQMLATSSAEFGEHAGLGLVPGRVVPVPTRDVEDRPHKIPHIGWTNLHEPAPGRWQETLFDGLPPGTAGYLVHSYHLEPDDSGDRLADCYYGGHRVTAAVKRGSIVGCQFHPEKSGVAGLRLLAAFLRH